MHRGALLLVRLLALVLILGVVALHVPLDALRPQAAGATVADAGCASGCCGARRTVDAADDRESVDDDADAPLPEDGCDQGCHCGCCGGLPLSAHAGPNVTLDVASAPASGCDRAGAARVRPLEVFHPPRA